MTAPFADLAGMLIRARRAGYAVGAFNVYDLASVTAALDAARAERAPVILALGERYLDLLPPQAAAALAGALIGDAGGEGAVGLHLDHAQDPASCRAAIAAGFSSVMIDGSALTFADNVRLTRAMVEEAHAAGVAVEGELGGLAAGDHADEAGECETLTDPAQATEFVAETSVDALAVSVGTVHGLYRGEPFIDQERLEAIAGATPVPLVLHGGSGIPATLLAPAVAAGIAKVNVNTEVSLVGVRRVAGVVTTEPSVHLSRLGREARSAMTPLIADYIRRFRAGLQ